MASEKVLSSKDIYQGRILKLRVDTVLTVDGRRSTREIIEHTPCIGVVAVDAEGNVLLVNQYRSPLDKDLLEIPAGGIDKGEDPTTAVIREMREETGLRPQKVTRLTGFYLSPGFCNEYMHLFLAEDLVPAPLSAEDTAGIEVVKVTARQISELIFSGKIEDSKSVAGLLYYLEYRKKHHL
jgi:ADP-ribose pyrophosphatase